MKTVSLIYGYSARNAGDFAITLGAIDVLMEAGCHVKLFSRYCRKNADFWTAKKSLEARYDQHIELFESPFCLDRTANWFATLKNYADGAASILGVKRNYSFRRELLDSDIIIFNGGNLFRCQSFIDYTRLQALLYPLKIAAKAGKPFVIFPQSASTLNNKGKRLLLPILRKAQTVLFREQESYNYLSKLQHGNNYKQTIDLAFFINKNGINETYRKKRIAITLRFHTVGDISYLPEDSIAQIFSQLATYVKAFRKEYEFIVVVQTDKDEENSKKFAESYHLKLVKSNDPIELLGIYKSVDLLIGMRLHSIILALSIGTPCFGVFYSQWGLKNPGLMKHFNMPFCMMDEEVKTNEVADIEAMRNLLISHDEISQGLLSSVEEERKKFMKSLEQFQI